MFIAKISWSLKNCANSLSTKSKSVFFIIGGGTIYNLFLPITDKLYVTIVDDAPEADTYFPDYSKFKNIVFQETHETDNLKYTFLELTK